MSSTQSSADVASEAAVAGNVTAWMLQEIKTRLPGR